VYVILRSCRSECRV